MRSFYRLHMKIPLASTKLMLVFPYAVGRSESINKTNAKKMAQPLQHILQRIAARQKLLTPRQGARHE